LIFCYLEEGLKYVFDNVPVNSSPFIGLCLKVA
jgi:hypothetical protein